MGPRHRASPGLSPPAICRKLILSHRGWHVLYRVASQPFGLHLQSALGILAILLFAWLISENRRAFPWRIAILGIALQAGIALLLLKVPLARDALFGLKRRGRRPDRRDGAGTGFVYGFIGGGPSPFPPSVVDPARLTNFAFAILPLVIIISSLSAILWYWRIQPLIVGAMAFVLKRTLGIGGAVGLGAAATVVPRQHRRLARRAALPREDHAHRAVHPDDDRARRRRRHGVRGLRQHAGACAAGRARPHPRGLDDVAARGHRGGLHHGARRRRDGHVADRSQPQIPFPPWTRWRAAPRMASRSISRSSPC